MDTKYIFTDQLNDYFRDNKEELKGGFIMSLEIQNYNYLGKANGFKVNYYMENRYKVKLPPNANTQDFQLTIEQKPPIEDLKVGDQQSFEITVFNDQTTALGMMVVVLSTPSCMTVDMNELEILKERGLIDNFQISPDKSSIVLYWTYIAYRESKIVKMTRVRKYGGEKCQARANIGYLYYYDENKLYRA